MIYLKILLLILRTNQENVKFFMFMVIIYLFLHKKEDKKAIQMTKLNLLTLFIIIFLSGLPSTQAVWITYKTFTGYIPSYTYPITLNAGDNLRAILSWPGAQDLDIYLYYDGDDLLSRAIFVDQEFSASLNPEDLQYTIINSGLYYLRVDLYSTVPTAYQFEIYINGVLQHIYYDTVITVDLAMTAQQFTIDGPCQVRIKYDGPIHDIYIFQPGADILNDYAVAADLSLTNPKYITQYLTSPGLWTIIIHHKLNSTFDLIPFNVVVETDQGVNQCLNHCSGIAYNLGLIPGYTTDCLCADGFIWDSAAQLCLIDCQYFNLAGDVGSIVGGTVDRCSCLNSNYLWNTTTFNCKINCPVISYSTGVMIDDNTCQCSTGFIWDPDMKSCIKDCGSLANTAGINSLDISQCRCVVNYNWDTLTNTCTPNLICGDGFLAGTEQCDDGNTVDGDGCNANCTFGNNNGCPASTPYIDPTTGSCTSLCPAGYYTVASNYSCPSCSANCTQCTSGTVCTQCQTGYVVNTTTGSCQVAACNVTDCILCPTSLNYCEGCITGFQAISGACQTVCGDNIMAGTQQCDDGNTVDGDGCNSDCTTGNNNSCPASTPYRDPITLSCSSVCPDGYYSDPATFSCMSCFYTCATCTNSTDCTSCSTASNRYLNGTQCLPNPGFYDNTTFNATPCTSPCSTCTSATACTTCVNTTYLSGTSCLDCSAAITNCLSCSSSTMCSVCGPGYIANTTTGICDVVPCIPTNCILCPTSTSVCEGCTTGYQLLSGACQTVCGDNIMAGTQQCDDGNTVDGDGCNADCTTGNNNSCPASTPYRDPVTLTCSSVCPDGYYSDPATFSCPSCFYTCATCTNSTDCTSCSTASNRYLNGTQCSPNPGFYDNTTFNATPCTSPCSTCTSDSVCTTCVNTTYLSGTSCLDCSAAITNCLSCSSSTMCSVCGPGYIANTTTGICDVVPCIPTNCILCPTSTSVCEGCTTGYQLLSGACQTVCGDNIMAGTQQCDDGNTVDGDGCNADCTTGNNNSCPASTPYRDPVTLTCSSVCPDGYYSDPATFSCLSCFYTCATCTNSTDCTSCSTASNRYLNGTQCLPNPGFYDNTTFNATPCTSPCSTCTSDSVCTTCVNTTYLSGTSCLDCSAAITNCLSCSSSTMCSVCGPGYIANTTTGICDVVPCIPTNCILCPTSTSVCEGCTTGYQLLSGACQTVCGDNIMAGTQQCDDGNTVDGDGCNADCTTGNNNSCPASTPYRDPVTLTCSSVCPDGYYSDPATFSCLSCFYTCATCTNNTDCTLCSTASNRYLNGTQCLPNPGFYDNTTFNATPCTSPCSTCTSATACTTCVNTTYLSGTSCLDCSAAIPNCLSCSSSTMCSVCGPGYIANTTTGICDVNPCTVLNCLLCPNFISICQGCVSGYQLLSGACQTVCGDNIMAGTQQCDDGNTVDGDGCNADCTTGNNNSCPASTPYRDPVTLTCSSVCPDGYYSDPATFSCPSCFYTCATCTNSTDCTSCSTASNRYLNGTQCSPNPGFYDNTTFNATPCTSPCSTCTSDSVCTTCVNTTYLSGTSCLDCSAAITNCLSCSSSTMCSVCGPGYIANTTTGICDVVPCIPTNCILCPTSTSVCEGCTTGYQLLSGACQTVCGDNIMAGTQQCDDGNTVDGDGCNADCTTGNNNSCPASTPYRDPVTLTCSSVCPDGYYSDPATFSCLSCFYTCGTCTNSTDCTSCSSSSNRYLNGTQCLPNPGFYDNSTFNATPCTTPCSTCTSSTTCTTCENISYLSGTSCLNCSSAISNCLYCTSAATCDQCQLGFIFNSTTNLCDPVPCDNILCLSCPNSMAVCEICSPGYQGSNGNCVTVCSDFVIAGSEVCDDGNTRQFDGCSTTCTVESDFTCEPDLINSAGSECFFIGNVTLNEVYINKVDNQNKVEIKLEFSHSNLAVWDDVNFLDMIKINCAVPIDGYEVVRNADGTVTITVSYADDIQGQPMDITIDPSLTNIPSLSRTTPSTNNLLIIPDDNEAAYFYDEQTYKLSGMVSLLSTGIAALAGVLFIVGVISGKMIGVQTMAVVQISFFALLSLSQMNPSFATLSSLRFINGYNNLNGNHLEDQFTTTSTKGIFLFSRFAQNFNFTAAIILIPLLVALVSFILSKTAFKQNDKVINIAKKAVGEYTLMAILFAGYLVSVSFALEVMYGIKNMEGLLGTVSIAECGVLLVLTLFYLVFIIKKPQFFGQFTDSFKKDSLSSKFYVVMLFERVLVGSLMVFMMSTGFSLAVPLAVFLILGIVVIVRRPHRQNYHTYRFVANMAISSAIMILFLVSSIIPPEKAHQMPIFLYIPIIICALLIVVIIYNTILLIYTIYKQCKQKSDKQLLDNQFKQFNKVSLQENQKQSSSPTHLLVSGNQKQALLGSKSTNIDASHVLTNSNQSSPLNQLIKKPENVQSSSNAVQVRKRLDMKQIKNSIKMFNNNNKNSSPINKQSSLNPDPDTKINENTQGNLNSNNNSIDNVNLAASYMFNMNQQNLEEYDGI